MNIETQITTHNLSPSGVWMGLDLSLTSTGMGVLTKDEVRAYRLRTETLRGLDRLKKICDQVMLRVADVKPDGVAIEGYSFGSTSNSHSIGELGGMIKMGLAMHGIPTIIMPPASLRKAITGCGKGAGKGPTMVALYKRFGIEMTQDDQADAVALSIVAAMHFDGVAPKLPAPHWDAMKKAELVKSPFPPVRRREPPEKVATALQDA